MSKFSGKTVTAVSSPVATVSTDFADTVTHEGGAGWSRDAKSELFVLAVTNMVSEKTFYEEGKTRDERFIRLIHQVTAEDPGWIARFIPYLRNTMNMRSASIVMAAEYVKAGGPKGRQVIDSAIVRADETQELLGYWLSTYGKKVPQPVKRGLADAAVRVINERNFIKYGAGDRKVQMADVIEIAHPHPKAQWQSDLFRYILDARHGHEKESLEGKALGTLKQNIAWMTVDKETFLREFDAAMVENSAMTWEQASSRYGKLDSRFWEVMAPNMGIFALVRNLRNFEDAGIIPPKVHEVLTDPEAIKKSRMFPLRFYTAFRELANLTFASDLEAAINLSLENVPSLKGRSLILVDVSGSMDGNISGKSKVKRAEVAALFGAALALRAEKADLVAYNDQGYSVPFRKAGSVLLLSKEIANLVGGGTRTWDILRQHLEAHHDRAIIITDEQAFASYYKPETLLGDGKSLYSFNVAGYRTAHAPSTKNYHTFAGLSDSGFLMLDLIERGKSADWPF